MSSCEADQHLVADQLFATLDTTVLALQLEIQLVPSSPTPLVLFETFRMISSRQQASHSYYRIYAGNFLSAHAATTLIATVLDANV